jgi:hypothetical protein
VNFRSSIAITETYFVGKRAKLKTPIKATKTTGAG